MTVPPESAAQETDAKKRWRAARDSWAGALRRHRGTSRTALFLASKDIFKDRKIAALVVCVIAFSFINLIFFTSFQYGLRNAFEEELVSTFTGHISIEPKEGRNAIEDVRLVEDKIEGIPGVVGASPNLEDHGISVKFKGKTAGADVVGVTPSRFAVVSSIPSKVIDGEFLGDGDFDQVALGIQVAGAQPGSEQGGFDFGFGVGAKVGDRVRILFSNGVSREYRVKGIIQAGGLVADFNAYLTRKEFESVFPNTRNKAQVILVRLSDRQQAAQYKEMFLSQGVREEVKTWEDKAGFVQNIGNSVSVVAEVTGGVGIITVAITMAIVIYINTTHKRRLMGVLKAIGATDGVVFQIFLFEALLFGALGVLMGVVLSQGLVGIFEKHPIPVPIGGGVVPDIRPGLLATGSALIMGAGLLSAYYPSRRAARNPIVKSIWG